MRTLAIFLLSTLMGLGQGTASISFGWRATATTGSRFASSLFALKLERALQAFALVKLNFCPYCSMS